MEWFGYIGGLLLALCAFPELVRTVRDKKCHIGSMMLWMWLIGELAVLIYVAPKLDWPLILNYTFNSVIIIIMLYYKLKDKHEILFRSSSD